jgi:hypothetical protein
MEICDKSLGIAECTVETHSVTSEWGPESEVEAEYWSSYEDSNWELSKKPSWISRNVCHPMQGVEACMAGISDKTGQKRGLYSIGGLSKRSIRRKKAEVQEDKGIDKERQERALHILDQQRARHEKEVMNQLKLAIYFSRKRSASVEELPPDKRMRIDSPPPDDLAPINKADTHLPVDVVPLEFPDVVTPNPVPTEEPSAEAEDDSDWSEESEGDVVVVKEQPNFGELHKEVAILWRKASKGGDVRGIRLLAALRDFYSMVMVEGRMESSKVVSKSFGKGTHFARSLSAHARYFELHHHIRPSIHGHKVQVNGLLEDEGILLKVKRWLRKQPAGFVSLP